MLFRSLPLVTSVILLARKQPTGQMVLLDIWSPIEDATTPMHCCRSEHFLALYFFRLRGKLWFVCIGRAIADSLGDQQTLSGTVYVFSDRNAWRGELEPRIRAVQSELRSFKYGVDSTDIRSYFGASLDALQAYLPKHSAFNATFSVTRTGMTTIVIDDEMIVSDTAPTMPSAPEKVRHINHILCSQIFFFLRDIGHRHQHHDPYTDTIVDLYAQEPSDPFKWKLKTLYSLYRKVISYKRVRTKDSYLSSLGVLAYANTFRRLIELGTPDDLRRRIPEFLSENVVASVEATEAAAKDDQQERSVSRDITRELSLGILALIIAVVGVFQITPYKIDIRPSPVLYFLAESIASEPFTTGAFIVVLVWLLRRPARLKNLAAGQLIRWTFRLAQVYDLRISIAIFAAIGVIILSILIRLL